MKTLARLFITIAVLLSTGCAYNMVAERDRREYEG
jgi:hypothetical protein